MKTEIIPFGLEVSCPLCLSKEQKPIVLKNFQRAVDIFFIEPNSVKTHRPNQTQNSDIENNSIQNLDLSKTPHFFKCENCQAVFRNPEFILPETEEHLRYSTHENNLEDLRYLKYLEESTEPFLSFVKPSDIGLDYGCGPTKGIEHVLTSKGFKLESYDKYFHPSYLPNETQIIPQSQSNKTNIDPIKYDYLFCHEVVEHFVDYKKELQNVLDKLKPMGQLFIRTELYPEDLNQFENWYYKNDSTHVFFLSLETFKYINSKFNTTFKQIDKNKFILTKINFIDENTQAGFS